MRDSVTVSGQIDFGTQYRASRAMLAQRRGLVAFLYGFFVGLPLLLLAILIIGGIARDGRPQLDPPIVVLLLLPLTFVFVFLPLIQRRAVLQMRRNNASLRSPITYTVSRDGLESRGDSFNTKLKWNAIHRVVETKEVFLFFVSAGFAQFIPKAFAASPDDVQAIREILQQALGDRAKLQAQ